MVVSKDENNVMKRQKVDAEISKLEAFLFEESDHSVSTDSFKPKNEDRQSDNEQRAQVTRETLMLESRQAETSGCVWHDSEDDEGEFNLVVDLEENTKLRKLKYFESNQSTKVTTGDLHKRLKAYKLKKSNKTDWVALLRREEPQPQMKSQGVHSKKGDESVNQEKFKPFGFFKTATRILGVSNSYTGLRSGKLQHLFLPDINRQSLSKSAVTCCGFLDDHEIFFCGGRDKSIRLFNISSTKHEKLAVYHMKHKAIKNTFALPKSSTPSLLFLAGLRSIGMLDIETGAVTMMRSISSCRRNHIFFQIARGHENLFSVTSSNGHILCCDVRTQCVEFDFKMNAEGHALTYVSNNDEHLCAGDHEGIVYDWDLRARRCYRTFRDGGSSCVTSLASCSTLQDSYLAVGSSDGFVNLYHTPLTPQHQHVTLTKNNVSFFDQDIWSNSRLAEDYESSHNDTWRLIKSFRHLTTGASSLAFHPSKQILAMASRWTRDAVKLIHLPSLTVFSNFPRQNKSLQLKYPECFNFNAAGSSFVIGNSHGHVKHIELLHFSRFQRLK